MPGTVRSSAYLPAPVVLPAESTRATDLPITENSDIVIHHGETERRRISFQTFDHEGHEGTRSKKYLLFSASPFLRGENLFRSAQPFLLGFDRGLNRLVHLRVSRTAAKIAAQRQLNLFLGRVGVTLHESFHRHHETGGAVSAL